MLFRILPAPETILTFLGFRLRALKAKVDDQRRYLDELDEHMYVSWQQPPVYYSKGIHD
jgi:hypothetical protein